MFYVTVNRYGHVEMVSPTNHPCLSLQAVLSSLPVLRAHVFACNRAKTLLESAEEENDHRNYFVINLQESMGLGRDQSGNL